MNNTITVVGNLTSDPQLYQGGQHSRVTFTIAQNQRKRGEDGEYIDSDPFYFRCVAWNEQAENIAKSLRKGQRVLVAGTLKADTTTDPEGNRSVYTELVIDEIGPTMRFAQNN